TEPDRPPMAVPPVIFCRQMRGRRLARPSGVRPASKACHCPCSNHRCSTFPLNGPHKKREFGGVLRKVVAPALRDEQVRALRLANFSSASAAVTRSACPGAKQE